MIAAAFRAACEDELQAIKPGNVHRLAPGHRMTVEDFRRSAEAAAGPLCAAGTPLGRRMLDSVAATRAAVRQNTNLGIVLLCAPLAMAAEQAPADWQATLRAVLDGAGQGDAEAVFRAIVLASPGGLGSAPEHDVRGPATATLRAAMAAAAARDSIARQYATDFADVFGCLSQSYAAALARCGDRHEATLATYLTALATWPDSHVARKHGAARAEALRQEAIAWQRRAEPSDAVALLAWDASLKRDRINPGTSADLTVATIFLHRLRNGLPCPPDDG